jgi:hypothetical protein
MFVGLTIMAMKSIAFLDAMLIQCMPILALSLHLFCASSSIYLKVHFQGYLFRFIVYLTLHVSV